LPKASIASGPEAETATVPEAFGKVMVREAVGSVMAKVVLLASTVAPSKTSGEAPERVAPVRFTVPVVVKPVKPEATPPEVTPQELELIATEADPLPSVVTPVEDRVVKEPGPPLTAQVAQVIFPFTSIASGAEAETATVPEASGNVQVLPAVRSAEVIVPVKDAVAVVVCGLIAIVSVLAVVELKVAELVVERVTLCVPDTCVKPVRPEMAPAEDMAQLVVEMATVFAPPPIATAPVEVPVPMLTPLLDEAFKLIAAPEIVAPREPVSN